MPSAFKRFFLNDRALVTYPDTVLPPRPERRVMLERSDEHHRGFREIEVSQKRTKRSGRALTREQHCILLSSPHRVSDDVSGFVSATVVRIYIDSSFRRRWTIVKNAADRSVEGVGDVLPRFLVAATRSLGEVELSRERSRSGKRRNARE